MCTHVLKSALCSGKVKDTRWKCWAAVLGTVVLDTHPRVPLTATAQSSAKLGVYCSRCTGTGQKRVALNGRPLVVRERSYLETDLLANCSRFPPLAGSTSDCDNANQKTSHLQKNSQKCQCRHQQRDMVISVHRNAGKCSLVQPRLPSAEAAPQLPFHPDSENGTSDQLTLEDTHSKPDMMGAGQTQVTAATATAAEQLAMDSQHHTRKTTFSHVETHTDEFFSEEGWQRCIAAAALHAGVVLISNSETWNFPCSRGFRHRTADGGLRVSCVPPGAPASASGPQSGTEPPSATAFACIHNGARDGHEWAVPSPGQQGSVAVTVQVPS
ncbi:hypothetical protein TREES_T100008916 [Tupaia chinensis]|uniref:Uncharacterized protein n=1 Tax=Tupaia chinensis TaxID=246437 RepID=L9L4P8_TUPCH|nr:hypothetical protein TREES_T100008916 [Tupaia chinensis]